VRGTEPERRQYRRQCPRLPHPACRDQRVLGDGAGTGVVGPVEQRGRVAGEDLGAGGDGGVGRVVAGGQGGDGAPVGLLGLGQLARRAEVAPEPGAEHRLCGAGGRVGLAEPFGEQRHGRAVVARQGRRGRGPLQVAAALADGVGDRQRRRAQPVPVRLGVAAQPFGLLRRVEGRLQRLVRAPGELPVVGEAGRRPGDAVAAVQRGGVAAVQLDPLGGEQVRGDDLGHQAVPQRVAVGTGDDDEPGVGRLPHGRGQLRPVDVDDGGQQRVLDLPDPGRHGPHDLHRSRRQPGGARPHQLADGLRHSPRVPVEHGTDGLAGQEHVPAGVPPHQVLDVVAPRCPLRDQLGQLVPGAAAPPGRSARRGGGAAPR
jgi:hypothetical protein